MVPGLQSNSDMKRFISRVAEAKQSALLLDYDGTIAPFVVERSHAQPYAGVVDLLRTIMASGHTRVVIVTGRTASDIVPLLGLDPAPEIWGAHGFQRLWPGGSLSETSVVSERACDALREARNWLSSLSLEPQTEFKPGGVAVHWRGLSADVRDEIRENVLRGWFPIAQKSSMWILEFDGGVEFRVPNCDKGDAVRVLLHELDDNAPVAYLGDDVTDEKAFEALGERGLTVLVRREWRQTAARTWLRPPDELINFLTEWANASRAVLPGAIAGFERTTRD